MFDREKPRSLCHRARPSSVASGAVVGKLSEAESLALGLNSCFFLAPLEYNLISPGLCARAKRDLQSLDARGERSWLNAEKLGRPAGAINSVIRSLQCSDQVFTLQVFHFRIRHDFFLRSTFGGQRLFRDRIKLFSLFGQQHRVEYLPHSEFVQ